MALGIVSVVFAEVGGVLVVFALRGRVLGIGLDGSGAGGGGGVGGLRCGFAEIGSVWVGVGGGGGG